MTSGQTVASSSRQSVGCYPETDSFVAKYLTSQKVSFTVFLHLVYFLSFRYIRVG